MRFTYIFALAIVATLQVTGNALPTTKNSHVVSEKVISPAKEEATQKNRGRLLRRVEKNAVEDEERSIKEFGKFMLNEMKQSIPLTKAWKKHKEMNYWRAQARQRKNFRDSKIK
ncbi:Avirulence protein (Avh) [Phytophthora palmivora]|uniref:RxLR effector protein n=1 Tax=Phytophthora palmivora TaxID=4796 RepID=A0A2P4Y845_9STRA|nr:Avirulence protein (Avh) [Phytophthora palmivora]